MNANTMCMSVLMLCLTVDLFALMADERAGQSIRPDTSKARPVDNHRGKGADTPGEVVDLIDGADSAEAAIATFVAASRVADDTAALLMIDPPIRRLLIPDIALERVAVDSVFLEHAMFGEDKNDFGGILFHFSLRDLVRVQSIRILETHTIDSNRVVFTVLTTEQSYHEDANIHNVRQFLTIRRSGKWYVFRPIGTLMICLREPSFMLQDEEAGSTAVSVDEFAPVSLLRRFTGLTETPIREDADFEVKYFLPIETIHEHLVQAAQNPHIEKCEKFADQTRRYFSTVVNRAKRGEYKSRAELDVALDPMHHRIGLLSEQWYLALTPSIQKMVELRRQQSAAAERKTPAE